jgi:hypothetical protein
MKKVFLVVFALVFLFGCRKMDIPVIPEINKELNIETAVGLKLQSPFVTEEVVMNVKSDVAQSVTIKIFDIANRVVSKETMNVNVGDNILKVYTKILPSSAYRIGLYSTKGSELGITDFNKL